MTSFRRFVTFRSAWADIIGATTFLSSVSQSRRATRGSKGLKVDRRCTERTLVTRTHLLLREARIYRFRILSPGRARNSYVAKRKKRLRTSASREIIVLSMKFMLVEFRDEKREGSHSRDSFIARVSSRSPGCLPPAIYRKKKKHIIICAFDSSKSCCAKSRVPDTYCTYNVSALQRD